MEGGSNVDGDESGGTSPSRQDAGTGILVPRNLVAMAAEIGIASGEKGSGIEGFGTRGVYMPKGVTRSGEGGPCALPRRPGVGQLPFGPALVFLEAPGTLIFPVFFPEFLGHF